MDYQIKKMYEKEIDSNQNKIFNIETISANIEQAVMNADVVGAMAKGRDAQAALNKNMDPDNVQDVLDDIGGEVGGGDVELPQGGRLVPLCCHHLLRK